MFVRWISPSGEKVIFLLIFHTSFCLGRLEADIPFVQERRQI